MNARSYINAEVKKNLELTGGVYHLVVDAGSGMESARPGQFVMVRPNEVLDPLLARPFSIHEFEPRRVEILYRVVGRGTALLARLAPGQTLSLMGPLGRGFATTNEKVLLVAGGIGVAPFLFLARRLYEQGNSPHLLFGAKTKEELVRLEELSEFCAQTVAVTEDGSRGEKGLVTEYLEAAIAKNGVQVVYGCGPVPMIRAALRIIESHGVPFFVSLEEVMGCGVGVCLGCAVPRADQGYLHLCKDGPVLDAREVKW